MYKINRTENSIEELRESSFAELGFMERDHLQEWIAKEPGVFGEDLLIIQKEFAGFFNTRERLDLLTLDKNGSLVVIENKLDDSGRDVTWQALKYASYCSSLSKENIRKIYQEFLDGQGKSEKAEENLAEFLDEDYENLILNEGVTQRVILVAAKFRKEVTSTVLWLLNFKIRIQCFRATLHLMEEMPVLNFEQIIPTQDAEDYMIGMAEKARDEVNSQAEIKHRQDIRTEFWVGLIDKVKATDSDLFRNRNVAPSVRSWINAAVGIGGVYLTFSARRKYVRTSLVIEHRNKEINRFIFTELSKYREQIEQDFGGALEWEPPVPERRFCRIKAEIQGDILEKEQWDSMQAFMVDSMLKMEKAFAEPLRHVKQKLQGRVGDYLPDDD
ncbi:MAG: DUF4268 domain-containing protein [Cellvibrionales bacterium]|nr:DUF4268 domain-containing protein [Cellvibrionales bacterium]